MLRFRITSKSVYIPVLLVMLTLISRILLSENYFYGYDSVNYALAVTDFSLQATRPHLPGSILFVKSIEIINFFINNIHQSFLLLLYLFSMLATLFSYKAFSKIFNEKKALLLTLFLIFNPMVWFYGAVTEVYTFDWFFVSLVFYLSFKKNSVYILPFIYAVGTGFRPSSGVLLLPFYFYMLWQSESIIWKKLLSSLLGASFLFLLWFVPLINSTGGLSQYLELYSSNNPMEQISFAQNLYRLTSFMFYFILPFLLLIFFKRKLEGLRNKIMLKNMLFLLLPPILFFMFLHYSKGYILLIATPLVAFVGLLIGENYKRALSFAIPFEILFFLLFPSNKISMESKIKPLIREGGIMQIWIDRTLSDYNLSANSIVKRDEMLSSMVKMISQSNSDRILLGPTISHLGRALQIQFPEKEILSIRYKKKYEFLSFKGISVKKKEIMEIFKNDILIVRNDFYMQYLNNIEFSFSENSFNLIILNNSTYSQFQNVVESQFLR